MPGSCRLRVTREGLDIRHCFVPRRLRWDEVERFYVRTYVMHYPPGGWDFTGVAFTRHAGEAAGLGAILDTFRFRGIARSDTLPDTYGVRPNELARFLNTCRERAAGPADRSVPPAQPVTAAFVAVVSLLLVAFAALGVVMIVAGEVVPGLLIAALFTGVLFVGLRKWFRGRLRLSTRRR